MKEGRKLRRRNRAFEETHGLLIDTAIRLVSEKGLDSLSLSEVARQARVNRTTVYYHFDSRDALVVAVREWSARQVAAAFEPAASMADRTRFVTRFVLEQPEVAGLWAEEFLDPGDIRKRYPEWDTLIETLEGGLKTPAGAPSGLDAEVYGVMLLIWTVLGPRVYRNSVRPELAVDEVIERFAATQAVLFDLHGLGD